MAEYDIDIPGKGSFTVSAETDEQAHQAINDLLGGNHKSFSGFMSNVGSDAKEMAQGMGAAFKEGALDMPSRALETGLEMATGKAYSQTPSGQRDVDLVTQAPEQVKNLVEPIKHPIDYGYEHPVQQALNIASLGAPLMKATGAAETMGKYAGRMGENQMGKLHGTSQAQFRQLGRENFGPAMRSSYELGDADLTTGSIGRETAINERVNQLGSDIGDVRDAAGSATKTLTSQELADTLRKQLMSGDYAPSGKYAAQATQIETLLKQIEAMPDTAPSAVAKKVTELNDLGTGNKLVQAKHAPETHLANQMARFNDERIGTALPEQAEHYEALKDEFGNAASLKPMEARGEGKEALGQGSQHWYGDIKNVLHSTVGGPKMGAKVGFGLESGLNKIAKNGGAYAVGGVTAHLVNTLTNDPQSLGKYATPLLKAAQEGGNQALAATHYLLSTQYPEYNEMVNPKQ